jgi:hypothetical protein
MDLFFCCWRVRFGAPGLQQGTLPCEEAT